MSVSFDTIRGDYSHRGQLCATLTDAVMDMLAVKSKSIPHKEWKTDNGQMTLYALSERTGNLFISLDRNSWQIKECCHSGPGATIVAWEINDEWDSDGCCEQLKDVCEQLGCELIWLEVPPQGKIWSSDRFI